MSIRHGLCKDFSLKELTLPHSHLFTQKRDEAGVISTYSGGWFYVILGLRRVYMERWTKNVSKVQMFWSILWSSFLLFCLFVCFSLLILNIFKHGGKWKDLYQVHPTRIQQLFGELVVLHSSRAGLACARHGPPPNSAGIGFSLRISQTMRDSLTSPCVQEKKKESRETRIKVSSISGKCWFQWSAPVFCECYLSLSFHFFFLISYWELAMMLRWTQGFDIKFLVCNLL